MVCGRHCRTPNPITGYRETMKNGTRAFCRLAVFAGTNRAKSLDNVTKRLAVRSCWISSAPSASSTVGPSVESAGQRKAREPPPAWRSAHRETNGRRAEGLTDGRTDGTARGGGDTPAGRAPFTRHRVIGARLLIKLARSTGASVPAPVPRPDGDRPTAHGNTGSGMTLSPARYAADRPTICLFDVWDRQQIRRRSLLQARMRCTKFYTHQRTRTLWS